MNLVIPPGTTVIEEGSYSEREDIETVTLPESLICIGTEAFSGCTSLRELHCPASLRQIGPAAFMNCLSLRQVALSERQHEISAGCFLGCTELRILRFSTVLESISELALQSTALEVFSAPPSLSYIGEQAFFDCTRLREVNVPNPNCVIEKDAFSSCYELIRGFIAPGYCGQSDTISCLLYTILALSCPQRHRSEVLSRADAFVRANEDLMMEWVIGHDNAAAMTGMMERGLLSQKKIPDYVAAANCAGCTEITALLLRTAGTDETDTEFEL